MKGSGTIPTLVIFVAVVALSFIILLILPNVYAAWSGACDFTSTVVSTVTFNSIQNICTKSPIQIEAVIKPEYLPLTADHALLSLLESTDSASGKQIQELLAYGVLNGKSTFSLDGKNIDLNKVIDEKMNSLLPNRDYYLVIKSGLLSFGNKNIVQTQPTQPQQRLGTKEPVDQYRSSTTLTSPDLKKIQVVMFVR